MKKEYQNVLNKLEEMKNYELEMSRLFDELISKTVNATEVKRDVLKLENYYGNLLDLLDALKINDDELDVLNELYKKIDEFALIKELVSLSEKNEKTLNSLNDRIIYKNKHTIYLLKTVYKKPGIEHQKLADKLKMDKTLLSKTLKSIEKYNLFNKVKDGKNVHYFLTPNGEKYYHIVEKELVENMVSKIYMSNSFEYEHVLNLDSEYYEKPTHIEGNYHNNNTPVFS